MTHIANVGDRSLGGILKTIRTAARRAITDGRDWIRCRDIERVMHK